MKKILVSNDDGIYAEGIKILVKYLKEAGHEVFVSAPLEEQSGTGHGVTLHSPLRVTEAQRDGEFFGYAVNGKPADSVKAGISYIYKEVEFDYVIAGINRGANLGTDLFYSGTFAAASEGVFYGKKAIALSLCGSEKDLYFETAGEFVVKYLDKLGEIDFPKFSLLNINVPNIPVSEVKGVKYTVQSNRKFEDNFVERTDTQRNRYFWLGGSVTPGEKIENSDLQAVEDGYISVTPVKMNLYSEEFKEQLERLWRD